MTWLNPWAWLGLLALALPVLIHLLGRGRARVIPFPTLRFLDASKLLPTRRTRIHDAPLLLVRLAILLAAAAALARPVWLTAGRRQAAADALARAIVVERGLTTPDSLASAASASITVPSDNPRREIAGAVQWLERQPGRRELVIVSHFRRGAIDSLDLATVPPTIGMKLERVALVDSATTASARMDDGTATARTLPNGDIEWSLTPAAPPEIATFIVAPDDRARIDAAARAALAVGVPLPLDTTQRVAIVYPRATPPADLAPVDSAWMTTIATRVRGDSTLIAAASVVSAAMSDTSGLVLARDAAGRPLVTAQRGANRLVLTAAIEPASIASAALISAVARARAASRDPVHGVVPIETLRAWQRAPAIDDSGAALGDASDGRWLWIAALLLLGVETWMRRARRAERTSGTDMTRERAA